MNDVAPAPASGVPVRMDSLGRRLVDVVVAAVGLVCLVPLLAAVAAAVRRSGPGPVLFRQSRVGRNGRRFTIWKFRSMAPDAEARGAAVSGRADPRVTPLGRRLRATHLDELPQLVNVLRGDMTLVGPRPEVPRFVDHYREEERAVLRVRPGVLGPGAILFSTVQCGQLDGTGDPDAFYVRNHLHPKLRLDLDYLRHRSLRRDLALLGAALTDSARSAGRPPAAGPAVVPRHEVSPAGQPPRGPMTGRPPADERSAGGTLQGLPLVPGGLRRPARVVAGVCTLVLVALAVRYRDESRPGRLDRWAEARAAASVGGHWDAVVHAGDPPVVVAAAVLLAVVGLVLHGRRAAVLALTAPGATGVVVLALKHLTGRTLEGDLAMPSGHTAGVTSLSLVAGLLVLARVRLPVRRAVLLLAGTVVAAAAGVAVVMVAEGAHYATDTVAGLCAGVAVTLSTGLVLDPRVRARGG